MKGKKEINEGRKETKEGRGEEKHKDTSKRRESREHKEQMKIVRKVLERMNYWRASDLAVSTSQTKLVGPG
jgi:hypothetical protein